MKVFLVKFSYIFFLFLIFLKGLKSLCGCMDTMPMGGSQPTYVFISLQKSMSWMEWWNRDDPLDGQEG